MSRRKEPKPPSMTVKGSTRRAAGRIGRGKGHPRRGLPGVNLLSPATFDLLKVRQLRIRFAAGAVALVVLAASLWTVQHLRISETRKLVAVEQAETARLNSETRVLMPVKAYVAGVAAQKATARETMSREIYFSRVLDGIRQATPVGASLDTVAVTLAAADPAVLTPTAAPATGAPAAGAPAAGATAAGAPAVSACPGPDPFNTKPVIGCITLSGSATTRAQVGELVVALAHINLFVEPFISTTSAADQTVTFSGSVGLSKAAFSKRYGKPETTP